ncbi:hypothetical protein J6590_012783 [Homalodisca vitripennis]|nr:hypothetical protein J6590_012783 [Homalodisca vitripennis]
MDKVHLLEELAHLKRLIKNHENSRALIKLQERNADSVDRRHQRVIEKQKGKDVIDQRNCTIFINPVKMTAVHNKKQSLSVKNIEHLQDNKKAIMNNVSATVYINPNFSKAKISQFKSEISSSHNRAKILRMKSNTVQKGYISQDVKILNSSQEGNSSVKPQVLSLKPQASSTSVAKNSCKETSNLKIFINPEFRTEQKLKKKEVSELQSQTTVDVGLEKQLKSQTTTPSFEAKNSQLITESHSKDLGNLTDSNLSKEFTALSVHKKRKIYMNRLLAGKEVVKKRKRSIDAISLSSKKIFLNPKFKRGFEDLEVPSTSNYGKKINPEGDISVGGTLQLKINIENPVSKKKDQPVDGQKPIMCSPDISKKILIHSKELPKKIIGQRLRTRSTCLVSVSSTKLIRKRKSSQNMSESNIIKMATNKPILLTKNKLVRNSPLKKATMNNVMIVGKEFNKNSFTKYKVNHALQKTNALCQVDTNEIMKRKSIAVKSNITFVPTSSTIVARIRSKNGKSLKVVRKNIDRNKHLSEQNRRLSVNALQVCKTQTKQRANNKVLCNVTTNVTKKNQFSKVNVSVNKTSHLPAVNCSKYVYKKADRKERLLTKSALMDKTKKLALIKANSRNNVSERIKYIKSKYSLIRKQSLKSLKLRSNKDTKSRKISTLVSKRKWKLENHLLKNKRKNLKIVNIGGVFYHCSRTSLTRNKPTRKALQEKRKGLLLHIHGQKFQFYNNGKSLKCVDKNSGRRRIDIGGVTYIRSSTGTSLTKTNYHTARSILV